ncbi:uncharacterized protein LOC108327512 [Vigna angularis]|uniref:uncharacterized protein LOC108327512 n=1 Tax=Phaseolus angularis TaxID=3914 RepID=UPI00080A0B60|nr:uncharacterized protein LOC108327512 [Vigna angularis]
MEDFNTRDLIQQLQTQIEAQAQTIREQQELQRKQAEELAALRVQQPPPELSASNRHDNNEGSHHGGSSDPFGGGKKGPPSMRLTNLLPFTETIMQAHMPDKPPPALDRYDGSADPDNHLRNFIDAMAFYTDNDPVICRAFSLSLKDEALEWFHTLPRNSVDCFATIETLFRKQYATNRKSEMTAAELVNTKQEKDETLKPFMQRYNETARRVKDINHTFIISNLPSCLRPGYFAEQLYADPPTSMEELQSTIAKFIRIEDLRNSRKKQQQDTSNHDAKKPAKRPTNDYKSDRPPRKESGWTSKYDRYATLNAPRAKVLEEALHAELLTVRRRATPKNADSSKACRLHMNHGHDTEECNLVKDELERLIRAGYLQNYVKDRISTRATTPHRKDPSRRSPERSPPRDDRRRRRSRSQPRRTERERSVRGRIDTISGGFAGGECHPPPGNDI